MAGAGAGLILTTGQVVLADITTPERRGRTISIYQGTFLFAVGIGPFPGGLLAEYVSLAAPFTAYGLASLAATTSPGSRSARRASCRAAQTSGRARARMPFTQQLALLMGKIGFVLVSLISLMHAVVRTGGLFAIVPMIATASLGLSVAAIGFAMMIGSVAGLLAAYPAGWLTDWFGRKAVIVPATVMTGVSMLLFCFAPSYAWFIAACVAWGVASSIGGAAPAAYAANSAPPGMNAAAIEHLPHDGRCRLCHRPAGARVHCRSLWTGHGPGGLGDPAGGGGCCIRGDGAGDLSRAPRNLSRHCARRLSRQCATASAAVET